MIIAYGVEEALHQNMVLHKTKTPDKQSKSHMPNVTNCKTRSDGNFDATNDI